MTKGKRLLRPSEVIAKPPNPAGICEKCNFPLTKASVPEHAPDHWIAGFPSGPEHAKIIIGVLHAYYGRQLSEILWQARKPRRAS